MSILAQQADESRSLVIDLDERDTILVVIPGLAGARNLVRVTMLHKSGRRARLRVLAGADVVIHRDSPEIEEPA